MEEWVAVPKLPLWTAPDSLWRRYLPERVVLLRGQLEEVA